MKNLSISVMEFQDWYDDFTALDMAKKCGADSVDFALCMHSTDIEGDIYTKSIEEVREYFTSVKSYADKIGIAFAQTHGRMKLSYNDELKDKASIESAYIDLEVTKILDAPYCVMHPINSFRMGLDTPAEVMRSKNFSMLKPILNKAKECDVVLAIETLGGIFNPVAKDFFGDIYEFNMMLNMLGREDGGKTHLGVCLDPGHTNCAVQYGQPKVGDVIRLLGDKIVCVHLNDNNGLADQHRMPFTGTIDWKDVFDAFKETGYKGSWNLEVILGHFGREYAEENANLSVSTLKNYIIKNKIDF